MCVRSLTIWTTLLILMTCMGHGLCAEDKHTGPADDEDDIEPWPCPDGLTWSRCSVNLTCFDESEEEAMAKCGPGCYCPKRRFLYKGECIMKQDCPPEECAEDMEYSECGNHCKEMCPGLIPVSACKSEICYDGCFCKPDTKRFAGRCYKPDQCPQQPIEKIENFLLFNTMNPKLKELRKKDYLLQGPMSNRN